MSPGGARSSPHWIIVFLRQPRVGQVKSRLAAGVGPRRAAQAYRAFVLDTLQSASLVEGAVLEIRYTPATAPQRGLRQLLPAGTRERWILAPQVGDGLGERLNAATAAAFRRGAEKVLLLGSDCPLLGPERLKRAFHCLRRHDVVLGPACDGGYYLLGLGRPAPRLFQRIPWGTGKVLSTTLERARTLALEHHCLGRLPDVDTRDDLLDLHRRLARKLRQGPGFPRQTWALLKSWLAV